MSLNTKISQRISAAPFQVAWEVHDYRTGDTYGEHQNQPVVAVGAGRLLLLVAVLEKVHSGDLRLGDTVTYSLRHQQGAESGVLRWLTPEIDFAFQDALVQMVIAGDAVGQMLVCEHLERVGLPARSLIAELSGRVGLGVSQEESSFPDVKMPPTKLLTLLDALQAHCEGQGNGLTIDQELAEEAIRQLRSIATPDGLPGTLPGYGPNLAVVAHLMCDGGTAGKASANWTDAGIIYQDGQVAYSLVVVCTEVPEEVDGLPGPYAARRMMADITSHLYS